MTFNKVASVCLMVLTIVVGWTAIREFRHERETRRLGASLRYDLASLEMDLKLDRIQLDVGRIQFLRHGYSVVLESVKYGADGVSLKGRVGNPTNIWITGLTLDFRAAKLLTPEELQESAVTRADQRITKSKQRLQTLIQEEIGKGQSSPIQLLAPGTTAPFEVTIPNVKQLPSSDGQPVVVVRFSAARYSYREE